MLSYGHTYIYELHQHVWGSQFFLPSTRSPYIQQQQYGKSQNMHICCLPYFVCKNTNFLTNTYEKHDFLEIGVLFSVLHYFISWTSNKSSFFQGNSQEKNQSTCNVAVTSIPVTRYTSAVYIGFVCQSVDKIMGLQSVPLMPTGFQCFFLLFSLVFTAPAIQV